MTKRKHQEIWDLVGSAGISNRGLASLVRELRASVGDAVPAVHRMTLNRHAHRQIGSLLRELDVRMADGSDGKLQVVDPSKAIPYLVRSAPAFASMVDEAIRAFPADHIFSLVMYFDEITPGAVLQAQNQRKSWAQYCTLLEFGKNIYAESAWLPLSIAPSQWVHSVEGKLSAVLAAELQQVLVPLEAGFLLQLSTGPRLVRIKVACFLGDYDALKIALDIKGAGGVVPCPRCKNIVAAGRNTSRDPYLHTISCSDSSRFDLRTDDDIWATADALTSKRGRLSAKAFQHETKIFGVNYNPRGILYSAELRNVFRPMSSIRFDAMHIFFSNGVVNIEAYNLLRALESRGVLWSMVQTWFLSDIKVQGVRQWEIRSLARLFNEKFRKLSISHKMLRGGASQIQTIIPLLYLFVEVSLPPCEKVLLKGFLDSFAILSEIVLLLQSAKKPGSQQLSGPLRVAIESHLRAYRAAYGESLVHPKHHIALHLPEQLSLDGQLLDCYTGERKNKTAKLALQHVMQQKQIPTSALARLLVLQIQQLRQQPFSNRLVGKTMTRPDGAIGGV